MKKATLIFLALLVVLSFYMVIPSTVHASDGGGRQVVKVEHVKVNFNLKPLSAAQLKALRNRSRSNVSASPNVVAANACAAVPNDRNCDGQDPIVQGCTPTGVIAASDAVTTQIGSNKSALIGVVYLKWSDDCESNWSLAYSGYDYPDGNYTYYFVLSAVKVVRDDGLTEEYDQTTDAEGWSNMVLAPIRKTKACMLISDFTLLSNGTGGGHGADTWYCTGFY